MSECYNNRPCMHLVSWQVGTHVDTPLQTCNVYPYCKYLKFAPHVPMCMLTLKVLVATIDAQWEGMGDVGSARYEPALLPPCPTIRVLSYSS